MAKEKKHPILRTIRNTAIVAGVAYGGTSAYAFDQIFHVGNRRNMAGDRSARDRYQNWFVEQNPVDVSVISFDGLRLHGYRLMSNRYSPRWAVIVHGYNQDARDMYAYIYEAMNRGYNVLAIDQRGFGQSEGQYTGMSILEQRDLISWLEWLKNKDANAVISLIGVSMGASTVLGVIDRVDAYNVTGVVANSGFSDVKALISHQLQKRFNRNVDFLLPGINALMKYQLKYSLDQSSILSKVQNAKCPYLVIHGDHDMVVPVSMAHMLADANISMSQLWILEEQNHLEAENEPDYFDRIFDYLIEQEERASQEKTDE